MYRQSSPGQLSFHDFYLPFGGKLSPENRWVKLAEMIPWEEFESTYSSQFSEDMGAPAKGFRMALGALIIKEKLGISDRETIDQIRENPYLQYFLGLHEYSDKAPFDASMLVHFRKRIGLDLVLAVNESVVQVGMEPAPPTTTPSPKESGSETNDDSDPPEPPSSGNQGQLIVDASCAPADIHYPTDLDLLNQAREHSERLIDELYQQVAGCLEKKPRTYRQTARRDYLRIVKRRKKPRKLIRKGLRQQLNYVRRNLGHIDPLIEAGATLAALNPREYKMLLVIHEVYRQQQHMYHYKQRRIDDRIVSISQPHVRPIVRGKAGTPVEFGAKFAISCVAGYVFLDHLSWDNFNESEDLIAQIDRFRTRTGHYPASVHADQIYRTRDNLRWCKRHGIRLSGPPLGRPSLDETQQALLQQQVREDESVRVAVEGKFGQAKRRFGLGRVMVKLAQTAETMIAITCLVMNLEKRLRRFIVLLLIVLIRLLRGYQADVRPFTATLSDDWLKTLDHRQGNTDHVWAAG
ncbi:IS5 family transposase [Adonisia turfae]|uniref:IS5 family transposase n=1 Tax=Adonisia turfae CCMR0081 TaxID=2292702 RepID=A0A6M0RKX7_9CYAN|nr:IS5 family transposase [Adonisia turfae CCMR0081]